MMEADAKLHVLYCSVRDVTELQERSDVVTKLLPELERSNTQLAYVASHDLVQQLTTPRGRDDVTLCR
jgi:cell division FtsZ-interacting protein ZapD